MTSFVHALSTNFKKASIRLTFPEDGWRPAAVLLADDGGPRPRRRGRRAAAGELLVAPGLAVKLFNLNSLQIYKMVCTEPKKWLVRGLVKFFPAIPSLFCLALPASFLNMLCKSFFGGALYFLYKTWLQMAVNKLDLDIVFDCRAFSKFCNSSIVAVT